MEVIILGSRSNDCLELKRRVITALDELGVDSNVYIEEDAGKILSYEVETPPAVLFNDKILIEGIVPSINDLKDLISNEL